MPELQRIAQTMGIPGSGRMRKGQLVEAIEARQGGGPRQEAGTAKQGSDQRVASAGADSTRPRKQGAMEPDTNTQSGIGAGATSGLGDSVRGGIGTDGAGQQLSFDQETVTDRPNGRTRQASSRQVSVQQAPTVPLDIQLEAEREGFMACATTADFREGVAAFVERRPPRFGDERTG